MEDILQQARQLFDYTRNLRRDLHRHPELGFQEFRTAGVVTRELAQLGIEVQHGVAKTGVVGYLEGSRPGKTILIRFDMDALPIQEETGQDYASETDGLMHACGHDGHVAIGLTVAKLLWTMREQLNGSVKFIFQPAEEGLGGAEQMVAEGILTNPEPHACLALHLWNEKPVGWFGITSGPLMAGADTFRVILTGKGGHGALPQLTIDPVVAGGQVITALQTIVSRNLSPLEAAVVTVARLRAGEAFNVIPQTAEMSGTIRSFSTVTREKVIRRIKEIVEGVAGAMGCESELEILEVTPPVINDPSIAEHVVQVMRQMFPGEYLEPDCRTMVSEDMAFIMKQIPGCYFLIGSANPEKGLNFGHHHPKFDIDEEALPRAAALMAGAVVDYLK
jgi:amidohydrolase